MNISAARLAEAIELRDIAVRLVMAHGVPRLVTTATGDCRHALNIAEIADLTIAYGNPSHSGEQRLDVWQQRKVFSIGWDRTGYVHVIAFNSGSWRDTLRAQERVRW
jgi:hypothetical protein